MSRAILRHSRWDALLIGLSFVHGGLLLAAPSIPIIAIALWWNANTVSHNFIHLPFFRSRAWNRLYSLYLSAVLGFPQSVWRERHLAHHAGRAFRFRITTNAGLELAIVSGLWTLLLAYAPAFFLSVYLPGYAGGLALCYVHGYFEHVPETTSNYGSLYNATFFNDGYHVEHHLRPAEHWTRLPQHIAGARSSGWPAVLRWLERLNLEMLESIALRSTWLQQMLLRTHERALRKLLPNLADVRSILIVGGGMFPRSALLLDKLLPQAEITIIDGNRAHLEAAQPFLNPRTKVLHGFFDPSDPVDADLIVIPLSFIGDRQAVYRRPPARFVLVHDWIWSRHRAGVVVCPWLLKRINLVGRLGEGCPPRECINILGASSPRRGRRKIAGGKREAQPPDKNDALNPGTPTGVPGASKRTGGGSLCSLTTGYLPITPSGCDASSMLSSSRGGRL